MVFFYLKFLKEGDCMGHKDDVLTDDRKQIDKSMANEYDSDKRRMKIKKNIQTDFMGSRYFRMLPERK